MLRWGLSSMDFTRLSRTPPDAMRRGTSSLKLRILGGIFIVFLCSMGMVLYVSWTYQRDRLVEQTSRHALQTGLLIEAGLRTSMLLNDREATMETIRKMLRLKGFSLINVMNNRGEVVMSSDPAQVGRTLDKDREESCRVCHRDSRASPARTAVVTDNREGEFLRTVTVIANEPACYGCHAAEEKMVGILVIDSSLAELNRLISAMSRRIVLSGIAGFLLGFFMLHLIITRFLTRPLDRLLEGFTQIAKGRFDHWVDVRCGGEIEDMATCFNVMSRTIGRYVVEVSRKKAEVETHYTIAEALGQTIERKILKEVVVDLLCRVLDAATVTLVLLQESKEGLFEVVHTRKSDQRHYHFLYDLASGGEPQGDLKREEIEKLVHHGYTQPVFSRRGGRLLVPIQLKGMQMGLACVTKAGGAVFTMAERKIVPVLAHHITISFANARLYSMAVTDGLTSLYTKRYFNLKIDEYVDHFHEGETGFCVMILDLDHFKEVNDTHGHPVGDRVLVRIADLVRENIRHGDIPCRYGGEEFVVLLKGESQADAVRIAERIRRSVAEHSFEIGSIGPFHRTISIGLACFPRHADTAVDIVAAADAALYRAKAKGRNRVEVFAGWAEQVETTLLRR
ncbi:MAG TPA: diguanylate cyclase [Desulfobulbus sp.]|nr:diguanylate cyclase [Desulfobulbus sp.]